MSIPVSENINIALVIISAAFSFLVISPLTGWLTARSADGWIKSAIASVLAIIESLLAVWIAKEFDLTNLAATVLAVLAAAGIAYKTIMGELSKEAQLYGPQIGTKDKIERG